MRTYKSMLLLLMMATLTVPVIQSGMHIFKDQNLTGYYVKNEPPSLKFFTWRRWFSGGFQDTISMRVKDNIGMRNTLIRVNNQFDYSLFGLIHAEGYLNGKQGSLFQEDYIHEYTGKYFIGASVIDKKLSRLRNVMDSLASYHVPLILIFESGKASIYPQYIPDRFHPGKRTLSNYDYFIAQSTKIGLPFLDINKYFMGIKDTCRYPLFPRYGTHWSMYGVQLVADTLSKYIARVSGRTMPVFKVHHMHHSSLSLGTDYEIGEILNLLCPLEPTPGIFPMVSFYKIPPGSISALIVADSYYITLVQSYGKKMFGKQEFWYYNNKMYPNQNNNPPEYVDKSNLREKLIHRDMILLMSSEMNLHCGFWNFADEAFMAFHPELQDPKVYGIENVIRNESSWLRVMVNQARREGKPLQEIITGNAGYSFYTNYNNLAGKNHQDSIYHIIMDIKYNPEWLAAVEKKAMDRNISVDSMSLLDAIYTYEQSKKNH